MQRVTPDPSRFSTVSDPSTQLWHSYRVQLEWTVYQPPTPSRSNCEILKQHRPHIHFLQLARFPMSKQDAFLPIVDVWLQNHSSSSPWQRLSSLHLDSFRYLHSIWQPTTMHANPEEFWKWGWAEDFLKWLVLTRTSSRASGNVKQSPFLPGISLALISGNFGFSCLVTKYLLKKEAIIISRLFKSLHKSDSPDVNPVLKLPEGVLRKQQARRIDGYGVFWSCIPQSLLLRLLIDKVTGCSRRGLFRWSRHCELAAEWNCNLWIGNGAFIGRPMGCASSETVFSIMGIVAVLLLTFQFPSGRI